MNNKFKKERKKNSIYSIFLLRIWIRTFKSDPEQSWPEPQYGQAERGFSNNRGISTFKSFNKKIFLHLWKLILKILLFSPQKGFTFLSGVLGLEPEAKLNIFGSLSLLAAFITNCNAGLMFISGVWQTCTGTVFLLLIC